MDDVCLEVADDQHEILRQRLRAAVTSRVWARVRFFIQRWGIINTAGDKIREQTRTTAKTDQPESRHRAGTD